MGPSSVTVKWGEIPQEARNGEILGYLVKYVEFSHRHEMIWDSIQVDGHTFKATLSNLMEGGRYLVKVAGVTQEGVGVYSLDLFVGLFYSTRKSKAYVIKVKHEEECLILFRNTEKWIEIKEAQLSFFFNLYLIVLGNRMKH